MDCRGTSDGLWGRTASGAGAVRRSPEREADRAARRHPLRRRERRRAGPRRSAAQLLGRSANPFGNRRVGHIPGAANLDSGEFLLHQPPYTFKRADEIEALVRDAGMSPKHETIVHCQAGIRTTTGVFALALLGWKNVRAYDAAMAEWANLDDTPLVVEDGVAAAT